MALLDSKAHYLARAKEIGLSTPCLDSLQTHGIDSLGALAFAVGTTAGECSPQDFQQFILDKQIQLENSDELLLKRLIFESQTLFMTSIQNQVLSAGLPNSSDSNAKKLPPVERQTRITEQKKRLVGIIIQGGSGPSFELIDLAYTMIDSKSIKFIPQHRCTKRDTELLENTNKDKEILTIEQGRLTSKKSSLPNTSTSDALKLSNCFLRRALALDLAQVTSFIQINKYQHKKRSQLIPEFADIRWLPADTVIHDSQKVIPSSLRGEYQEGDPMERSNDDILVGTWRTPEQFVSKAQSVTHPMDECALEEITKDVIRFVSKSDPRLVSVERRKNLLKARIMAKQLEEQEMDLHRNLPELVEKVVGGKRIFLWKRLLEQNGYDMEVVKFMTEGVPLVGSHDHPSCYSLKLKAASMSEEELRDSALSCRTALENRRPQTEAWRFAEHVEETAAEEVKLQFLEGPFYSSGHDQWRIMRQFVIQQDSKLRPIDDGLEAQLNAAYTSTIRLGPRGTGVGWDTASAPD